MENSDSIDWKKRYEDEKKFHLEDCEYRDEIIEKLKTELESLKDYKINFEEALKLKGLKRALEGSGNSIEGFLRVIRVIEMQIRTIEKLLEKIFDERNTQLKMIDDMLVTFGSTLGNTFGSTLGNTVVGTILEKELKKDKEEKDEQ